MTNQTNAVNPSVIRQYESACTFEVPTTELGPDYITVTNGFFSSYQEAADVGRAASEHSACLGFRIIPHDKPIFYPFAAMCNFEVPTTELDPDCVPNIWVIVGEFATFEEAKAACYSHKNHPALIAMQVHQDMRAEVAN